MLINDLFKSIIESITDEIVVEETLLQGNELRVKTCYTSWLHNGIKINNKYTVTRVEFGKYVWFRSNTNEFGDFPTIIDLPAIKFIYGTYLDTNEELVHWEASDKNPFVWSRTVGDIQEATEQFTRYTIQDFELFILSNCNYSDWLTSDHTEQIIKPLDILKNRIITEFANHKKVVKSQIGRISSKEIVKFGEESEKGNIKKYFNSDLSGWSFSGVAPVKKCYCEDCKC